MGATGLASESEAPCEKAPRPLASYSHRRAGARCVVPVCGGTARLGPVPQAEAPEVFRLGNQHLWNRSRGGKSRPSWNAGVRYSSLIWMYLISTFANASCSAI